MKTETRSTCCYCGVGCGVLIEAEGGRITGVRGDPEHPANYGKLCSKGMALADTARSTTGRALQPEMRAKREAPREAVDWPTALDAVAQRFAQTIEAHGPDSVALYVSGQMLTEDYYAFNKLAKGLIGTNNIDTNSRLCMSSAVTAYKMAFGADGPPPCYDDLEHARTVLFAGSNAAWAHPVLFRRLEAAKAADPSIRWIVVDPRRTDTAAMADLHLAIAPGTDVALFNGMLHHLIWEGLVDRDYIEAHTEGFAALKAAVRTFTPAIAAQICGIDEADLVQAAEWFGASEAALSLYCMGLNQSSQGTGKNLALINLHLAARQIGKPGAGPFSLTGQPNAMGGREVGGMATMLAAHRDIGNAAHREEVARLWGVASLSARPGLPAVQMFDALRAGTIKAVWIVCTNPAHSMPDNARVRKALEQAEFVVVQEAFTQTDTVPYADVLLPAASWGEKSGTVTNSERRISRVRAAVEPPGEAKPDWWIAVEVARRIEKLLETQGGKPLFGFDSPEAIFNEHRLLTEGRDLDIGGLDYATLDARGPQQWPFRAGSHHGEARRYTDGRYATANGRARFHALDYQPPADTVNARFPFRLTSGRLRDQWHGMSRTGRVGRLFTHAPEPALDMHAGDAARRGLRDGDLVRVISRRGELVLPMRVSEEVPSGTLFAPMHWNAQFMSSGGINEVTDPAVDPHSSQPELKHAAVRVEAISLPWRVSAARRGDALALQAAVQPLMGACRYASLAIEDDLLVLRAAHTAAPAGWLEQLYTALGLLPGDDTLEYRDARRGLDKRALWRDNVIQGFVLAGDVAQSESLLAAVRAAQPWQGTRLAAFAARRGAANAADAAAGTPRERIVCSCRQVGAAKIQAAIAQGASVADLKASLGCGTVCGSCVPELRRMCAAREPAGVTG
ncbi:nitrate reductase [Paraburkholderia ferrariae]|uniref:nitrate reductase n=1 Tax=Paraburkholderia ferrariae TaxID=386056 RepID=UPI00048578C2|nr:nitrate reductase [Paraburkholderia ferrariae]